MVDTNKNEVIAAIASASGEVDILKKGDRNKHGGYDFASIDKFIELVNPLCAEHGLVIEQNEVHAEILERTNKKNEAAPQLWMQFDFTVHHSSGGSLGPMRRSIMIALSTGAQAFGIAQSYALKQFLRSLFLIPTGDKDVDNHKPEAVGGAAYAPQQEKKPDIQKQANTLKKKLEACEDKQELAEMWDTNIDLLASILDVSKTAHDALHKVYNELEADFDTQEAQT